MATTKQRRLDKLEEEVRELRREFELFIPSESIEEYKNANTIREAHANALTDYSPQDHGDH